MYLSNSVKASDIISLTETHRGNKMTAKYINGSHAWVEAVALSLIIRS